MGVGMSAFSSADESLRAGTRLRESGLQAALVAAVLRGGEPAALARHLSQRHGSACLVFEPMLNGWRLSAAQGAVPPHEGVDDPRRWVASPLPGRRPPLGGLAPRR